ncbi:16S rRNA (cytidine(1402)-2'-O)-methyltransferase [Endozoicomonas sp. SM1973]|uniref:Ribosomal RNA small subunit methyltransferase I n=1 Tax=Spartinivicinus marinus TaxID=2994442 RepID=A0A853HV54_9GAMM|nr:16S rRNA (cytidine(1402)-2'-O)-methyltransferase [Spartinivicinus marinus]MCX4028305.1 16S rRNA (cytidine(1402)-2'-O)-methyltransferase [Spartinivicinus marinus]NYZ65640.1 16S rRNA (cytidine(1402)-2'-O)-methyltransferase [Spartinivicinus marinus]
MSSESVEQRAERQGVLYIVATPIGNMEDMTPRAVKVLQSVDLIAAEDTRHSGQLLKHFVIRTPLVSYHDHNERARTQQLIEKLLQGQQVALISDAGTPLVSDPGYQLVKAAQDQSIKVVPVPGASAMIAALSAAGLPSDRFWFEGFLPHKQQARQQRLEALLTYSATVVCYESCHRIVACIEDLVALIDHGRQITIAREITKTFETIKKGSCTDLLAWLKADPNQQKGEFVVLIEGAAKAKSEDLPEDVINVLDILLAELSVKQASQLAAKITGYKKKQLYELALARKQG